MPLAIRKVTDISLGLDDSKFKMRTPPGFKRDMQFQPEVLKEPVARLGALAKAVGAKANRRKETPTWPRKPNASPQRSARP